MKGEIRGEKLYYYRSPSGEKRYTRGRLIGVQLAIPPTEPVAVFQRKTTKLYIPVSLLDTEVGDVQGPESVRERSQTGAAPGTPLGGADPPDPEGGSDPRGRDRAQSGAGEDAAGLYSVFGAGLP